MIGEPTKGENLFLPPEMKERVKLKSHLIREALGRSLYSDMLFFFRSIILSDAYDVKVFVSRRACVLVRIFSAILDLPDEKEPHGVLINDVAVPFYMAKEGKKEPKEKRILIIDDLLLHGNSLLRVKESICAHNATGKNWKVDCMVFAKNKDKQGERKNRIGKGADRANDKKLSELNELYKAVFAAHEWKNNECETLGEKIATAIAACNFPYVSFLPVVLLDHSLPRGLRERYICFDDSFYDYRYAPQAQENQDVDIFAIEKGTFHSEAYVSDSFLSHYKSPQDVASLIPFAVLSEALLRDQGRMENIYTQITGEAIPKAPDNLVRRGALESIGKLLTFLLSLDMLEKCFAQFGEVDYRSLLDKDGISFSFGEEIREKYADYMEAAWFKPFTCAYVQQAKADVPKNVPTKLLIKSAGIGTYKKVKERFLDQFWTIKKQPDDGQDVDPLRFHELVSPDPPNDDTDRATKAAALIVHFDEGRAAYDLCYKDGSLLAVVKIGERSINCSPDLLPFLWVEKYYEETYKTNYEGLRNEFRAWFFSRFSDKDEANFLYQVNEAMGNGALHSSEHACRYWDRHIHYPDAEEILAKGISIPQTTGAKKG